MPVSRFHDIRFQTHHNFPGAEEVFTRMRTAPKFVFSPDVIDWTVEHSDDYSNAVATAIGAGRTELPYNTMLIKWKDRSDERIFWLIDEAAPNSYRIWAAFHYPRAKRTLVFGYPFPASFTASGEAVQRYDGPSRRTCPLSSTHTVEWQE